MDALVRQAVFGERRRAELRALAASGRSARRSACGRRRSTTSTSRAAAARCGGFTVPAINVRGMSYDTARAIFRTAIKLDAGAFILEIARSEIAYTEQRPAEYVAVMLAAALREGFRGPVFIQGDHFQVNHKKYAVDPVTEVDAVKELAREAIAAGFYNIDVDTSTLVDLSQADARRSSSGSTTRSASSSRSTSARSSRRASPSRSAARSARSARRTARVEELRAFMDGFNRTLAAQAPGMAGLSKISVQSRHVARRRGARRRLDRRRDARPRHAARRSSKVAREEYGLCRRGAARRVDAARHARSTTSRSARRRRSISRRTSRTCCTITCRPSCGEEIYAWLRDEREGRAQGERHRRAVLLQDAQEGDRPVQAAALGPARRREGEARRGLRREVRRSCSRSSRVGGTRAARGAVREGARAAPPDADERRAGGRGGAGRRRPERLSGARRRPARTRRGARGLWLATLQTLRRPARRTR